MEILLAQIADVLQVFEAAGRVRADEVGVAGNVAGKEQNPLAEVRGSVLSDTTGTERHTGQPPIPCSAAERYGHGSEAPVVGKGWSIDSRTIAPGDVFFAIPGERHDGHVFVREVFQKGAVAAVVSQCVADAGGLQLRVDNTIAALQRLAAWARRRWGRTIVGVTGSAGKTTTKDVIAALLATRYRVGKTTGNLNNYLGLPLSLLRLADQAEVGVIELGMNHAGEIRDLAKLAKPQIGVVTNVGYAHMEAFDSIDSIALAKRELIEALPSTGTAVLNADDPRVARFAEVHRGPVVTFGTEAGATVRAENIELGTNGVAFDAAGVRFRSKLMGRHGILNILAGLAVAKLFEVEPQDLVEPVSRFEPGPMRGERRVWRGITILNDCYNSNPDAVRFMIDVLKGEPAQRRIAVLGEMLELGRWAEALHREVGEYLANAGIDVLVGIRGAGSFTVDAAISGGMSSHAAYFFNEPEEAGAFLRDFVRPSDAILFKGSRGSHAERALAVMES
jgi:UDP-N-acetylmuramoyl-tripeptide--D-alanyl-D-alanine ligase